MATISWTRRSYEATVLLIPLDPAARTWIDTREAVALLDTPLVVGPANNQLADDSVSLPPDLPVASPDESLTVALERLRRSHLDGWLRCQLRSVAR